MRGVRRRQLIYGVAWGAAAFLVGVAATWLAVGTQFSPDLPRWRAAAWVYLGANYVGVEGIGSGLTLVGVRTNMLSVRPEFAYLRALPVGLCVLAGVLVSDSIGYTSRPRYLIENGVSIALGYAIVGIAVIFLSNAQPSFTSLLLVFLGGGVALFIGGTVISRVSGDLPFLGVASLGTVFLVGLLVLAGGFVIVQTLAPLFVIPVAGGLGSAVLLYIARSRRLDFLVVVVVLVLLVGGGPAVLSEQSVQISAPDSTPNTTESPVKGAVQTQTPTTREPAQINRTRVERLIHQYVNRERTERGLPPLSFDRELRDIARYHSRDMGVNGYFAHGSPGGETFADRYERFGYNCRVSTGGNRYLTGAENIAYRTGYRHNENTIAQRFVSGWMDSPTHRKNILTEHWNNEGIGVYVSQSDGRRTIYATQNFC